MDNQEKKKGKTAVCSKLKKYRNEKIEKKNRGEKKTKTEMQTGKERVRTER